MPDPVEAQPEKAPRKRRAATATRKRHDPSDAPTDGFRRGDQIVGQRKGFRYAALTPDEAAEKRHDGYRRVERAPDAPRFKYWNEDTDAGSAGYTRKGLTLYEIREDQHARIHADAVKQSDDRMAEIGYKARESGGTFTSKVKT